VVGRLLCLLLVLGLRLVVLGLGLRLLIHMHRRSDSLVDDNRGLVVGGRSLHVDWVRVTGCLVLGSLGSRLGSRFIRRFWLIVARFGLRVV